MACCGRNKNKVRNGGVKPNSKICPRCGWVMNRVHKYDQTQKKALKYWLCPNKAAAIGKPCNYREEL